MANASKKVISASPCLPCLRYTKAMELKHLPMCFCFIGNSSTDISREISKLLFEMLQSLIWLFESAKDIAKVAQTTCNVRVILWKTHSRSVHFQSILEILQRFCVLPLVTIHYANLIQTHSNVWVDVGGRVSRRSSSCLKICRMSVLPALKSSSLRTESIDLEISECK